MPSTDDAPKRVRRALLIFHAELRTIAMTEIELSDIPSMGVIDFERAVRLRNLLAEARQMTSDLRSGPVLRATALSDERWR